MARHEQDDSNTQKKGSEEPLFTAGDANSSQTSSRDTESTAQSGTVNNDTTAARPKVTDAPAFPTSSLAEVQYQASQRFADLLWEKGPAAKKDKDDSHLQQLDFAFYETPGSRPQPKVAGAQAEARSSQLLRNATVEQLQVSEVLNPAAKKIDSDLTKRANQAGDAVKNVEPAKPSYGLTADTIIQNSDATRPQQLKRQESAPLPDGVVVELKKAVAPPVVTGDSGLASQTKRVMENQTASGGQPVSEGGSLTKLDARKGEASFGQINDANAVVPRVPVPADAYAAGNSIASNVSNYQLARSQNDAAYKPVTAKANLVETGSREPSPAKLIEVPSASSKQTTGFGYSATEISPRGELTVSSVTESGTKYANGGLSAKVSGGINDGGVAAKLDSHIPLFKGKEPVATVVASRVEPVSTQATSRLEQAGSQVSLRQAQQGTSPLRVEQVRLEQTASGSKIDSGLSTTGRIEAPLNSVKVNSAMNEPSIFKLDSGAAGKDFTNSGILKDFKLSNNGAPPEANIVKTQSSPSSYKPEFGKSVNPNVEQISDYAKKGASGFGTETLTQSARGPINSYGAEQIRESKPFPVNSADAIGLKKADLLSSSSSSAGEAAQISKIKTFDGGAAAQQAGNSLSMDSRGRILNDAKSLSNAMQESPALRTISEISTKPGLGSQKVADSNAAYKDPIQQIGGKPDLAKPFTNGSEMAGAGSSINQVRPLPNLVGGERPAIGETLKNTGPGKYDGQTGPGGSIFDTGGKPINLKAADGGAVTVASKPGEIGQNLAKQPSESVGGNTLTGPRNEIVNKVPGNDPGVARPNLPSGEGAAIKQPGSTSIADGAPRAVDATVRAATPSTSSKGDGSTLAPASSMKGDNAPAKPLTPGPDSLARPYVPADSGSRVNTPGHLAPSDAGKLSSARTPAANAPGFESAAQRPATLNPPRLEGNTPKPPGDNLTSAGDATNKFSSGRQNQSADAVTAFEQATQRVRQLSDGRLPFDLGMRNVVENALSGRVNTVREIGPDGSSRPSGENAMRGHGIRPESAPEPGRPPGTTRGGALGGDTGGPAGRRAPEVHISGAESQPGKAQTAKVDFGSGRAVDGREPQARPDVISASPGQGAGRIPLSGSVRVADFQPTRGDGQIAGLDGRAGADIGRAPGMRGFHQVGDGRALIQNSDGRAPRGETHRYITGLELALILSIAGIAKIRHSDSRGSAARLEGRVWSIGRHEGRPVIFVDGRQNPLEPQRSFGKGDAGSSFRIMVASSTDAAIKLSTRNMRTQEIASSPRSNSIDANAAGRLNLGLLGRYHYLNYFGKNFANPNNNYYGQFRTTSYSGSMGLAFVMAAAGMTRGPLSSGLEATQAVDRLNPNMVGPADRIRIQNQSGLLTPFGRFNLEAVLSSSTAGRDIGQKEETDRKDESFSRLDDYEEFLSRLDDFSRRKDEKEDANEVIDQRLGLAIENLYDVERGEEDDEVSEVDEDDDANNPLSQILRRPKWVIEAGQTLDGLAEKFFSNADLGWLIADLNRSLIRETYIDNKRIVELQSRQEIELPVWQDIQKFNQSRKRQWTAENLVTIVVERQIDREVVDTVLGKIVGAEA